MQAVWAQAGLGKTSEGLRETVVLQGRKRGRCGLPKLFATFLTGFPIDVAWMKPAGKVMNCGHVTVARCNANHVTVELL